MSSQPQKERHSVLVVAETAFTDRTIPLKPVQRLRVTARVDGGPAFTDTYDVTLKGKEQELAKAVVERWKKAPKPSPFVGREIQVET